RVVVLGVELLFDALLELLEDLLERLLLFAERDRLFILGELRFELRGEVEEVVFVGEEVLFLRGRHDRDRRRRRGGRRRRRDVFVIVGDRREQLALDLVTRQRQRLRGGRR